MKVNVLTENKTRKANFLAEHGLSVYIEYNGLKFLFDTGQTNVYCHNASLMGIDLRKTDYIILSHGHYDHCGGYVHFPYKDKYPQTYISKKAFEKKFALNSDGKTFREIGIPWKYKDFREKIIFSERNTKIADRVYLCSNIPYVVPFEEPCKSLYVDNNEEKIRDRMSDEQMLIFDTDKGLVIFIGCSHPGIANCLSYAIKQFPGRKIYALFAGMHMEAITEERFVKTIEFIKKLNIEMIIPVHCTGIVRTCDIKQNFKEHCLIYSAGDSFII